MSATFGEAPQRNAEAERVQRDRSPSAIQLDGLEREAAEVAIRADDEAWAGMARPRGDWSQGSAPTVMGACSQVVAHESDALTIQDRGWTVLQLIAARPPS